MEEKILSETDVEMMLDPDVDFGLLDEYFTLILGRPATIIEKYSFQFGIYNNYAIDKTV